MFKFKILQKNPLCQRFKKKFLAEFDLLICFDLHHSKTAMVSKTKKVVKSIKNE